MPVRHKSTPGPRGESCLTCRKRRKKCDRTRPFCRRCVNSKGRFICQGYDDEPEADARKPPREEPTKARQITKPFFPLTGVVFGDAVPGLNTRSAYFGASISASEINDYLTPSVDDLMVPVPENPLIAAFALPTEQDRNEGPEEIVPEYGTSSLLALPFSISISRGIDANKQMRQSYFFFILEEYECHRIDKFFKPPPIAMRDVMAALLKRSRIIGFMYMGAKIFETFGGKTEKVAAQSCSQWITRYANQVTNPNEPPNPYSSMQDVEDKLVGLLELSIAQFIVFGTATGYATLRLALPSALRIVSDYSNLWVEQERTGLLYISLPEVLTSNLIQIRRFVYHDIMYSLVLGLPTLAEYDSTGFPVVPGPDVPVGWIGAVHGVPVEMSVNIAEVHNWRAQRKGVDWRVLETRTLEWRWRQMEIQSEESVEMVYRAAIQESWRHTTLIYIYMGICGVTSHDPRVQASVHQIVKLMRVVGDTRLDVHFSIPSVIAGLAAQHESQRTFILRKLRTFNGVRLWILQGRDFARVLVNLWRGPAANGAPVEWDDYVRARCEVLPIR